MNAPCGWIELLISLVLMFFFAFGFSLAVAVLARWYNEIPMIDSDSDKRIRAGKKHAGGVTPAAQARFLIALHQIHDYGAFLLWFELWQTQLHPDTLADLGTKIVGREVVEDPDNVGFYRLDPYYIRLLKQQYPEEFATPIKLESIR